MKVYCVTQRCDAAVSDLLNATSLQAVQGVSAFCVIIAFTLLWSSRTASRRRPLYAACGCGLLAFGIRTPFVAIRQRDRMCEERNHHSQFGEDMLLSPLLRCLAGSSRGTFVELGALDGVQKSNTVMLERCYGWTGLLIEANPRNFAQLSKNGRLAHIRHSAVCAAGEHSVRFTVAGDAVAAQVDAMSESFRRKWAGANLRDGVIEVPCAPLSSLMATAGLHSASTSRERRHWCSTPWTRQPSPSSWSRWMGTVPQRTLGCTRDSSMRATVTCTSSQYTTRGSTLDSAPPRTPHYASGCPRHRHLRHQHARHRARGDSTASAAAAAPS